MILVFASLTTACARTTPAAPAEQRRTLPPWSAPRDTVSYIEAAGLEAQPLNSDEGRHVLRMSIVVDGSPVQIPAYVGVDRIRAVQAAVHTHDASGQVWLEGRGTADITLGQYFTVWGVRFDDQCLGAACSGLTVRVDGKPAADPSSVRLAQTSSIEVEAASG